MILDLKDIGKVDFTVPVVVVTGSRHFEGRGSSIPHLIRDLFADIWEYRLKSSDTETPSKVYLYHGGAKGADTIAANAFKDHPSVIVVEFPADWSKGKGAVPLRNQTMLDTAQMHSSCYVIGFPMLGKTNAGTRDCLRRAIDHPSGKFNLQVHPLES
jgi:hypothetical protein